MVITLIGATNLRRPIDCSLAMYATMPESAQKKKSMIERKKNVWKATQKKMLKCTNNGAHWRKTL